MTTEVTPPPETVSPSSAVHFCLGDRFRKVSPTITPVARLSLEPASATRRNAFRACLQTLDSA